MILGDTEIDEISLNLSDVNDCQPTSLLQADESEKSKFLQHSFSKLMRHFLFILALLYSIQQIVLHLFNNLISFVFRAHCKNNFAAHVKYKKVP